MFAPYDALVLERYEGQYPEHDFFGVIVTPDGSAWLLLLHTVDEIGPWSPQEAARTN